MEKEISLYLFLCYFIIPKFTNSSATPKEGRRCTDITKIRAKKWLFYLLLLLASLFYSGNFEETSQKLAIRFYDVGQGDAILLTFPDNFTVLIDGGPDAKVLNYLTKDINPIKKHINMVILSHAHKDHYNGLLSVLQEYDTDILVLNRTQYNALKASSAFSPSSPI